jgi:DNA-binding response OmpR family regulator
MTAYVEPVMVIVDDDESQIVILKSMLEKTGYRVMTANSAAAALDITRSLDEPIELLVTDVVMPHMDGKALAAEARKNQPELRVLYVTAFPDELFGESGLLGPLDSYIEKPVSQEGLLEAVRMLLRRPVPHKSESSSPDGSKERRRRRSHSPRRSD